MENSDVVLVRCVIAENTAYSDQYTANGRGGGIHSVTSSLRMWNCEVRSNYVVGDGGGLFIWGGTPNDIVANCTIVGNLSNRNGAGLYQSGGQTPLMLQCTFSGNRTNDPGSTGGAIFLSLASALMQNCILWSDTPNEIGGGTGDIRYCDIQGGWFGQGNLNQDPIFSGVAGRELDLAPGSPCIDSANELALPVDAADLDLDGNLVERLPIDIASGLRLVNGRPDIGAYEYQTDCNANSIVDPLDIQSGHSADCNSDSIPDECQADCNTNGIPDDCDIAYGGANDCNANEIPDTCELATDCNSNGIPDACDVDCNHNGTPDECESLSIDCNHNGIPDSCEFDCNADGTPDECQLLGNDCNTNGILDACDITAGLDTDCDGDGVPNSCELFANDCNGDSVPDDCELIGADCNNNNQLDSCDIAQAVSQDANADGLPDECALQPYCFGDGTGTPCPCMNVGGGGHGCANSVDAAGGLLRGVGCASLGSDTLTLLASSMANSSALYLQATLRDNNGFGIPIQDGLRCITGSIIRLGTRANAGGASQYPDLGDLQVSVRGLVTAPGVYHYQVYYRNAASSYCPPGKANWTNGLSVTWAP